MKQAFGYFLKNAKFRAALGLTLLLSYGYAIATDTGSAMQQGHALVDLFYDTFDEAYLSAVQSVNVYIL